jgi:hypothetical protein
MGLTAGLPDKRDYERKRAKHLEKNNELVCHEKAEGRAGLA